MLDWLRGLFGSAEAADETNSCAHPRQVFEPYGATDGDVPDVHPFGLDGDDLIIVQSHPGKLVCEECGAVLERRYHAIQRTRRISTAPASDIDVEAWHSNVVDHRDRQEDSDA